MPEQHETILLEILTPEKTFLTKEVTLVVVPSEEGDLGVMAHIAPMLCSLRPGVICIFDEKLNANERYFVASGTAWINDNKAILLVPEVFDLKKTDDHTTLEEIKKIEAKGENIDQESKLQLATLRQKHYSLQNIPYA